MTNTEMPIIKSVNTKPKAKVSIRPKATDDFPVVQHFDSPNEYFKRIIHSEDPLEALEEADHDFVFGDSSYLEQQIENVKRVQ